MDSIECISLEIQNAFKQISKSSLYQSYTILRFTDKMKI